jgi:PAS domain S-box-containing protein
MPVHPQAPVPNRASSPEGPPAASTANHGGAVAIGTPADGRQLDSGHLTLPSPSIGKNQGRIVSPTEVEERLRESEALLAQAEQLANIGAWEVDVETQTVARSEHFYRMLGLKPVKGPVAIGGTKSIIHPDDRERAIRDANAVSERGCPFDNELRFIRADGSVRIFHSRGVPVTDETGRVVRVRGMSQDVTEQREAEVRVRRSEALLAQAEELANMGSWELDVETRTLTWSKHHYRMLGLKPEKDAFHLESRMPIIHPDDRERALRALQAVCESGRPLDHELRFVRAGGTIGVFNSRALAVKDETGRVVCVRGMSQDITERREAEDRVRRSEALLAQAEQIANFGSWEFDMKTREVILSPHLRQMYGLGPDDEWNEDLFWERMHPDDRQLASEVADRGMREKKSWGYIARYLRPQGGFVIYFVRGVHIYGADGAAVRAIGVVQDITERTRTEQELRRLSHRLLYVRDEDRRHMARELHESAGQSLAALKMTLGRLRQTMKGTKGLAHELWKSANDLAEGASREVRTISYLMHPPLLDEAGLGPALRWYAKGFEERSGIRVKLDMPADLKRQSQEIETTLFRVVQEALTNVHRYSGSATAGIRVFQKDGRIVAEVRDDGCGLMRGPARGKQAPPGVGIAGMRERVTQLSGVFEMESAPGQGTTIRATLPFEASALPDTTGGLDNDARSGKKRGKTRPAA